MKRFLLAAAFAAIAGTTLAQGTFTIRRPADGATVRETVPILIPKNSIPDGGYLGIYVNGKFLEAVMPDVQGDNYVYQLDTKKRNLPDGEHTIEVVLFVDFSEKPRIVNRSSVTVRIDNVSSINVPNQGMNLRYRFSPGREWKYAVNRKSSISIVSQALAQVGGRAAERDLTAESTRIMYAIDNAYNRGAEGLVRIQGLPDKGRDYTVVTTSGSTEPTPRFAFEMHPIYMRVTNTGREVFSAAPSYFPLEGTAGDSFRTDLFYVFPMPVLPSRTVRPGDVWEAPILLGDLDLDNKDEQDKFTRALPARGSFEGVEWFRGRRTARIRMNLAVGPRELAGARNLNQVEGEAAKIEIEQVIWFDLDRGIVLRTERNTTQETIVESAAATGGPAGGPPGFGPQGPGGGRPGPSAPPDMGPPGGALFNTPAEWLNSIKVFFDPKFDASGNLTLFQVGPGAPPSFMPPGAGGPPAGFGGPGRGGFGGFNAPGGGGGAPAAKQVMRIQQTLSLELEPGQ